MTRAGRHTIVGVSPAARGAVIAETMRAHPSPVWVVVAPDLRAAEQLAEDVGFFSRVGDAGFALQARCV